MIKASTLNPPAPFNAYYTTDEFGRKILFYFTPPIREQQFGPLVLFIQGSGCHSHFKKKSGDVAGGYQNLLHLACEGNECILIVEKPGVLYLDDPETDGQAIKCSDKFHQEHTLQLWSAAIKSALLSVYTHWYKNRDNKILVIGHSEGGIVAAHLASQLPIITHIALLSTNGPSQLFDLIIAARNGAIDSIIDLDLSQRVSLVLKFYSHIKANPNSIDLFFWGHPYKRWSSFLSTSTFEQLMLSKAQIFLIHGVLDSKVPIESFDWLISELAINDRLPKFEYIEGADHGFRSNNDENSIEGMVLVFKKILQWCQS